MINKNCLTISVCLFITYQKQVFNWKINLCTSLNNQIYFNKDAKSFSLIEFFIFIVATKLTQDRKRVLDNNVDGLSIINVWRILRGINMVIIKLHKIKNYVYTEKIINDRYFKYKIDKAQSYFPSV